MQLLNKLSEILHKFVISIFFFFKIVIFKAASDSKPILILNHLHQSSFFRKSCSQMLFKIGVSPSHFPELPDTFRFVAVGSGTMQSITDSGTQTSSFSFGYLNFVWRLSLPLCDKKIYFRFVLIHIICHTNIDFPVIYSPHIISHRTSCI